MKKKAKFSTFSASDYLSSDGLIYEYIRAAAESGNSNVLIAALSEVAKARGMARVAKDAGLGRESMYKTLADGSHPRFETIAVILKALNLRFTVEPNSGDAPPSNKAFDKIAGGLREAIAVAKGEVEPAKWHNPIGSDENPPACEMAGKRERGAI